MCDWTAACSESPSSSVNWADDSHLGAGGWHMLSSAVVTIKEDVRQPVQDQSLGLGVLTWLCDLGQGTLPLCVPFLTSLFTQREVT